MIEMSHEIKILIDDSENVDCEPPYHTDFVIITGWKYLTKKVQKEVLRRLKEQTKE